MIDLARCFLASYQFKERHICPCTRKSCCISDGKFHGSTQGLLDVSQLHPVVLVLVLGHQNRCRPFLGLCPVGVPQVATELPTGWNRV
jgi:hypothetical protein